MKSSTFTQEPDTDPTPIFEAFRWRYGSLLLTGAVAHFGLFEKLAHGGLPGETLRARMQLRPRPFNVLMTAMQAMGFIHRDSKGLFESTQLAQEHLDSSQPFYVGDYLGLAADAPEVIDLVQRLKTDRPADIENKGAAFIYRAGVKSAMEESSLARHFTLSLAGRARNVAPALARQLDLNGVKHLVDVAGGTGIYALALLEANPDLQVTLVELPEVLAIAREIAAHHPCRDRLHCVEGDMFEWQPRKDMQACLFSNIFHDWNVPECQRLIHRYTSRLQAGGRLIIHDVFLNDALDGPLPIALYSAALFTLTEGRAYAVAEYRKWMEACGLSVSGPTETLVHCGLLTGRRDLVAQ
ncbi:MAG: methyltransferase [Verrucomicrobiota bacterium]|nr:methyltransferase [Verrucomicrobiota bacterium]